MDREGLSGNSPDHLASSQNFFAVERGKLLRAAVGPLENTPEEIRSLREAREIVPTAAE
jgi:hypothetical protein